MIGIRSAILIAVIATTIPFIIAKPHVGILVWSWLAYMNPHRLTWGVTNDFWFAQIIAVLTIVCYVVSREPKRIPVNTVTVLLILFAFWMCVSTLFAVNEELATNKLTFNMKVMLMTFLTFPLIRTRERLQWLVWVITFSIAFFGIKGGLWILYTGGKYTLQGPERSMIASNNDIAYALSMVVPLLGYVLLQTKHIWIKLGMVVSIALCGISIAGTYARGVYVGMVAVALAFWVRSRYRILMAAVGVLGVIAIFAVMPSKFTAEVDSIKDYQQEHSATSRIVMWKFGLKVAMDRPIFGGGFLVFPYEPIYPKYGIRVCEDYYEKELYDVKNCIVKRGKNAHSNYFEVAGELGFVGFFLYMAIMAATFLSGSWIIRNTKQRPDLSWASDLAKMVQLSLIAYAVGGLFYNRAYFDLYYSLIAIMVITRILVAEELLKAPLPATERQARPDRWKPSHVLPRPGGAPASVPHRPHGPS